MKAVVCIATHQRTTPLQRVLANLPLHWTVVLAYTDKADLLQLQHQYDGTPQGDRLVYVHAKNEPLGAKWQAAVNKARTIKHDWLVITGSDDVLLIDEQRLEFTLDNTDFAGVTSWCIYTGAEHWLARYTSASQPLGAGRFYRADLLERMNYDLFVPWRRRGLDRHGYAMAMQHHARPLVASVVAGLQVVSLKGPWDCLNPLDKLFASNRVQLLPFESPHNTQAYAWA